MYYVLDSRWFLKNLLNTEGLAFGTMLLKYVCLRYTVSVYFWAHINESETIVMYSFHLASSFFFVEQSLNGSGISSGASTLSTRQVVLITMFICSFFFLFLQHLYLKLCLISMKLSPLSSCDQEYNKDNGPFFERAARCCINMMRILILYPL